MAFNFDDKQRKAAKEVAMKMAKKKMSKQSKTGKRLDEMEMKDAPRRPFLTKAKNAKKTPPKRNYIIPRSPTN